MNDRIVVPFAGPGSGTGGLTWGQRQIWDAMVATDTSQSLRAVVPLDGTKSVDDLAGELRFFLSRYPSMRSRLVFDEQGRPTQVVAESGQAELFVLDVPEADDPARAAEELADRWEGAKFDYENEWPMRLAAVRHGGAVTHVVVVLNHLAADAGGVAVMMDELGTWDPATDVHANLPAAVPATGLADWQDSPGGQRQSDSALRYWERLLRAAEPERFQPVVPADGPRFRQLTFVSPALLSAARTVASRTAGATAPVLLAAYAVALARTTGVHPVLTQTIVSNRFRPGLAAAVHPVSQNGLLQLDVAEVSFDVAVERAARASVLGSKHSYYDPVQWEALKERVDRERGVVVDIGCVLNDRRLGSEPEPEPEPEAFEPSASVLAWGEPLPLFNERLMVTVEDAPDAIELLVEVDTHAMTAPMVEAFVFALESVVLDAATNAAIDAQSAGIPDGKPLLVRTEPTTTV